jgi:hypothetical protein
MRPEGRLVHPGRTFSDTCLHHPTIRDQSARIWMRFFEVVTQIEICFARMIELGNRMKY